MSRTPEGLEQEVWDHLKPTQLVYLATAEAVQPRVRPMTLLDLDEKFWIATGTHSAKAQQILKNPNVEFCVPLTSADGHGYIRVAGVARVIDEPETRRGIGAQIPFLADYWEGPDDPDFCLIRITRVEVEYMPPGVEEVTTFIV